MVRQLRRDLFRAGLPHLACKVARGPGIDGRPTFLGGLAREDAERILEVQAARWPEDTYAISDTWWAYYQSHNTPTPVAYDVEDSLNAPLVVDTSWLGPF
jgi:hypothetical protein